MQPVTLWTYRAPQGYSKKPPSFKTSFECGVLIHFKTNFKNCLCTAVINILLLDLNSRSVCYINKFTMQLKIQPGTAVTK